LNSFWSIFFCPKASFSKYFVIMLVANNLPTDRGRQWNILCRLLQAIAMPRFIFDSTLSGISKYWISDVNVFQSSKYSVALLQWRRVSTNCAARTAYWPWMPPSRLAWDATLSDHQFRPSNGHSTYTITLLYTIYFSNCVYCINFHGHELASYCLKIALSWTFSNITYLTRNSGVTFCATRFRLKFKLFIYLNI